MPRQVYKRVSEAKRFLKESDLQTLRWWGKWLYKGLLYAWSSLIMIVTLVIPKLGWVDENEEYLRVQSIIENHCLACATYNINFLKSDVSNTSSEMFSEQSE